MWLYLLCDRGGAGSSSSSSTPELYLCVPAYSICPGVKAYLPNNVVATAQELIEHISILDNIQYIT